MGKTYKDSKKYYKGDNKPKRNPKDKNKSSRQWERDERDARDNWKQYESR